MGVGLDNLYPTLTHKANKSGLGNGKAQYL